MKKIFNIMDKYYNVFICIALFLLLFYPFNISIRQLLIPNDYVLFFIYFLGTALILLLHYKEIIKRFKKKLPIGIVCLFICLLILIKNGDLNRGHFGMPFFMISSLINIYFLSHSQKWIKPFLFVCLIYSVEHIFFTILFYFIPEFYKEEILPLFPDSLKELTWQFEHKQMAGLTFHYSTNAGYLTFGLFLVLSQLMKEKKNTKNWYIYLGILVANIIAILMTGKRAHVFFTLFVVGSLFLILNGKFILNNKGKTCAMLGIASIIGFFAFKYIDLLSAPAERLIEGIENGNLFYTRKPMYTLAIDLFKGHELIGNGWGTYKYFYNEVIVEKERDLMDAHNIYLQMLCEIGILGILLIMTLFGYLYFKMFKLIKDKNENSSIIYMLFMLQSFILLEGIVGNPIYDIQEIVPYMFVVSAFLAGDAKKENKEELENERENFEY